MNLQLEEQLKLTEIVTKSGGDIQKAVLAAYEEGILVGALRTAQRLGREAIEQQQAGWGSGGGSGDDDEADSPLTDYDRRCIQGLGIDPNKKYRHKNSTFTISGYKASCWKYPIFLTNQNGRRLKCAPNFIKTQCRPI